MTELENIEDREGFPGVCSQCGTNGRGLSVIRKYLIAHEEDIALKNNDFGDLSRVFIILIGRIAESPSPQNID